MVWKKKKNDPTEWIFFFDFTYAAKNNKYHGTIKKLPKVTLQDVDCILVLLQCLPVMNANAKRASLAIMDKMTGHALVHTYMTINQWSQFWAAGSHKIGGHPKTTQTYVHRACTKYWKTKENATIKQTLKIEADGTRPLLHKYVQGVALNFSELYHVSIDCEASWVSHGAIIDTQLTKKPFPIIPDPWA